MVKKEFLAYVLYTTLLEIRDSAYNENNSRIYHLTDMLHNVPFSLLNDEQIHEEYERILQTVETLKISDWLNSRIKEFRERFPDVNKDKVD